jgi:hypothetical protein
MAKFEDEIKRKLNEGEVNFNPDHWAQLNEKLDAQNQYTPFEKKAKDILDGGVAGIPAWDDMNDRLNHASPSEFEKTSKEILNSGNTAFSGEAWEDMRDELSNQDLTEFERTAKTMLKDQEVPYNPEHWADMEARLNNKKKRPIGWWTWGGIAAAVMVGALAISGVFSSEEQPHGYTKDSHKKTDQHPQTPKMQQDEAAFNAPLNAEHVANIENDEPNTTTSSFDAENTNGVRNNRSAGMSRGLTQNKVNSPLVNDNSNTAQVDTDKETELQEAIAEETKKIEALKRLGIDAIDLKYAELGIGLDKVKLFNPIVKKPVRPQLHAAATLWLNFWTNPAVTGFYGKNQFSNCFKVDYETVQSDNSEYGKLEFVQPIQNIFGYERQLGKSGFSVGGYYSYTLKKNWNYNDMNITASYKKQILPQTYLRLGAAATLKHEQLDVKRLNLREKALYSDYIFTGELGDFRARSEHFISYDLGGFIDHPYFFAGYTAENVHQTFITKGEEEYMTKHLAMGGVHFPILNHLKLSAMLKYEKGLTDTYSPSLGLTLKNKYYAVAEYNKMNRCDLTLGYNYNQKLRVHGTFAIKDLPEYEHQLNLDRFEEREGYMSVGIYYTMN